MAFDRNQKMSILYQTGCTVIACTTCFTFGLMYAWPSSTVKIFSSANTTLHRPMYKTEIALFGSLPSIGTLISTPLAALLLDILGRKYSCAIISLTQVVPWAIVVVSNRVEAILVATFICGMGGSSFLTLPIFISEFCQDSIRGMMTSGTLVAFNLGMLMSYLLGGCLEYNIMIYTCLSMSVTGVVMLWPLRESPMFLMKKGLEEDAAKAIAFYRHMKVDSKEVIQEMNKIRNALNPDFKGLTPEEEKLNANVISQEKISKWKFLKKSRSTRRALFIIFILYTAAIFQGFTVVLIYAQPLFEEAIPTMSPTLSSVLLAIVTLIANCIAAYLVDTVGRRVLILYCSIGAGICCLTLGSQIQLLWGPHWITAVIIYLYSILYTCGAGTVPLVLVAEVFLPEIKSGLSMICMEWASICNFTILFIFNPLVNIIGLGPVFYIFAGICIITAVITFFFLPETKGLAVHVIQAKFDKSYT